MAKGIKTGGRRKGSLNLVTKDLRSMIEGAFQGAGGMAYLRRQADENPVAFMSLLAKLLPRDVNVLATLDYADLVLSAARRREDRAHPASRPS